jgi:hypothetical protein
MKILNPNWLTTKPFDFELKKYVFLTAYVRFENAISNNQLFSTLNEIEYHLNKLYRLKYQKDTLDQNRKIITGIDLDLMDLEYKYLDEDPDIENIYEAIEFAIIKLESLHKKIRVKWQLISNKIQITEIPDRKPTKLQGIVFISVYDRIKIYSYVKPHNMKADWTSLILKEVGHTENTTRKMAEFISKAERQSDNNRFWRFDFKNIDLNNMPFDDCVLPLVTYNLFNKLKF